jgi:predicted phosphodiesterase
MRYLVLSDIHANLEALETVLAAEPPASYDRAVMLGDLVGYGADPNAVVDRIRALDPAVIIRGNHDKVASGVDDAEAFNAMAREAAIWTANVLTPANRRYLADLPVGPTVVSELFEVCHGSPFDEDAYIFDELDAIRSLKTMRRPLCIFGHTHVPVIFVLRPERLDAQAPAIADQFVIRLEPGAQFLVNPGSVGQPRDGNPRAAYAILDEDRRELVLKRIAYNVRAAQEKIVAAGLPEALAHRLALGR